MSAQTELACFHNHLPNFVFLSWKLSHQSLLSWGRFTQILFYWGVPN